MSNSTVFVVLGVDSHLERIKKCISTIKLVYGDQVDIGVSTFGNGTVPPSRQLESLSKEAGYVFYDSPRQDFIKTSSENSHHSSQPPEVQASAGEFHVCEILGNIDISKHYYDMGYEEVFLLHSDLFVVRDFLPLYRSYMTKDWAFVSAYLSDPKKPKPPIGSLNNQPLLHMGEVVVDNETIWVRMAQAVLVLNKDLVNVLFEKYGTQAGVYYSALSNYSMYGDIALAQIATGIEGFSGNPVFEDTMLDPASTTDVTRERILEDSSVTHIHGMDLYTRYYTDIEGLIAQAKI